MLINLSNHPSANWSAKQTDTARQLARDIIDYDFPAVSPEWNESQVVEFGRAVFDDVIGKYGTSGLIIHLMGEFTLTYVLVKLFTDAGIPCIASCSERITSDVANGMKCSKFEFVRFRRYING